jgi:hypothetical protein
MIEDFKTLSENDRQMIEIETQEQTNGSKE